MYKVHINCLCGYKFSVDLSGSFPFGVKKINCPMCKREYVKIYDKENNEYTFIIKEKRSIKNKETYSSY